ncbi:MAG: DUF6139 family protein [Betaproteobacteria bacterium]|nr:DUF6139 family protein [Betaproteobacteria bacterium]
MRVDIFRREERDNYFSYLIVPEGRLIPAEATNIDWEVQERGMDLNLDMESLDEYSITQPAKQIQAKGYAISTSANIPGVEGYI